MQLVKSRAPRIQPQSLFLFGAVIAVFLAGRFPEASAGSFLVLSGLALLVFPPQIKIPGVLFLISALMTAASALAFLPQSWFGIPAWRAHLLTVPVPLGNAVSTVPMETGFWLVLLAISMGSFLFCLAHPLRTRSLLAFTSAAILAVTLYDGLAIYAEVSGRVFWFDFGPNFGFFPNRNNTAAFLEAGSLLSLGAVGVVKGGGHWKSGLLAAAGLAVNATALIFYSASRGGVIFLGMGVLLWVAILGRRHWSRPLLISFMGLLMAGSILFWVSGGEARNRVKALFSLGTEMKSVEPERGGEPEKTLDGRVLIYRDTWKMIRENPWTGVGLGAFRHIFPQYREASLAEAMSIHPESDWLMLAAEAGLPTVLAAGAGIFLLIRRLGPERRHPYWPLRAGLLCAVLIVALHGMVDVPLHRPALGWFVLVLAGAAFQRFSETPESAPRGQRLVYWATGLSAVAMGVFLIRAEWFQGASSPFRAAARIQQEVQELTAKDQLETAAEVVSEGILKNSMAYDLYYQKGVVKLSFNDTDAEVDGLFAAERALVPDWPLISINQGLAWMNYDHTRAAQLWQDALQRQRRIDRVQGNRGALSLFENLLAQSAAYPDVQKRLLAANAQDVSMTLLWLERVEKGLVAVEVVRLGQEETFLAALSEKDRGRFLKVWYEKGQAAGLFAFLEAHTDWETAGWAFRIRRLVEARQFEEAVAAVVARHPVNLDLASTLAAWKPVSGSEDPREQFAYYWEAGNEITARRILEEAMVQAGKAKMSPDLGRLSAILAIREGRWEAAWSGVRRYLLESGVDGLP